MDSCSGVRISGKGDEKMKCHRCGSAQVNKQISDLPFKLDMHQVLIVKNVPCQICDACGETMLNDAVLASIDQIIDRVKSTPSELDVVPYAA